MENTSKQNVLVIEDNENARRLLDTILRSAGYDVTMAPDAEEGLRTLEGGTPVDLILLDLILPGADGVQFLRMLAEMEQDRQPPVIVVSATEDMDTLRPQLRELGAKLALRKPFDVQELLDGVSLYVTNRTGQAGSPAPASSAPTAKTARPKTKGKSAPTPP
jgi:DNA-binding response OmpR family regulator